MLLFIALRGVRAPKNVAHLQAGKTLYRDRSRVVECLLQLKNKKQIMPNNVET